jgi:hypothetical protein
MHQSTPLQIIGTQHGWVLAHYIDGAGELFPVAAFIMAHLWRQYRVFDKTKTEIPPDGSEDLQLVLAASKCLDLLIALQTEEFQM